MSKLEKSSQEDPTAAITYWTQVFGIAALRGRTLSFCVKHTKLPILLKGILHTDNAKLALEHGVDGMNVSNHGGRQVDGAMGATYSTATGCQSCSGKDTCTHGQWDSSGPDVIKAMTLSAKTVLDGRPCMRAIVK